MKITIELTAAQETALAKIGVDTNKAITEFAEVGVNNKLKGAVMAALKRVVVEGESQYKTLSAHMELPMSSAEFMLKASKGFYESAQSLGGRTMKPLDEIVRAILAGDSAVSNEE
jgi:hypothetical protein